VQTPPFTPNSRATGWALFGLLAVAAAWGSSFPLTKALLDRMSALNFLAVRFSIAALLMIIVFFPALRRLSRRALPVDRPPGRRPPPR
jgi:drug/metabolite transporter (DMT)-like permease